MRKWVTWWGILETGKFALLGAIVYLLWLANTTVLSSITDMAAARRKELDQLREDVAVLFTDAFEGKRERRELGAGQDTLSQKVEDVKKEVRTKQPKVLLVVPPATPNISEPSPPPNKGGLLPFLRGKP